MKQLYIKQSITDRTETLKDYLRDINRYPLLSVEEEKELGKRAKTGDKEALNKLIVSNLRFVVSVAKQYQGQGIDLIDLIQYGNEGLIEAASKYDVDLGFKFISYAVWWIRQKIVLALSTNSRTIRIPTSQITLISKINKAISTFEIEHERKPSNAELANITGIKENKIPGIINSINQMVSIDNPIKSDEDSTLVDIIPNKNSINSDANLIKESEEHIVNAIIKRLNPRDQDIIRMYFGIGTDAMTLDNIASKFGLTNERVRQLKDNALKSFKGKHLPYIKKLLYGRK